MSLTVCIAASAMEYPRGGGHFWVYMNWAMGLRSLGCRVIWLEGVHIRPAIPEPIAREQVQSLKSRLARYEFGDSLALFSWVNTPLPAQVTEGCLPLDTAAEADVLLNFHYNAPQWLLERFKRTALIDIDPGLLQIWLSEKQIRAAKHDVYFSTGETVGKPGSLIPDVGIEWHYTPPCVSLDAWPPAPPVEDGAFTTVSHWHGDEWVDSADGWYINDKRAGFAPYFDLPQHTNQRLELALCLGDEDAEDRKSLEAGGWNIVNAHHVAGMPWEYQDYIRKSKGEFSCVKPSCVRLQNAWVSDRTLCYLASGRPAVVQHTGPSHLLPDRGGLLRFRNPEEAVQCLESAAAEYPRHCRLARQLAMEHFDATLVTSRVLERAFN